MTNPTIAEAARTRARPPASTRYAEDTSIVRIARIAGLWYLLLAVCGAFAEFFVRKGLVVAGAVAAIGILLFPLLKKHDEAIALGYASTRIVECVLLLVAGTGTLALIPLGEEITRAGAANASHLHSLATVAFAGSDLAFQIAMIALGLGSMPFCYLLYRTKLIPRPLAALGFVGYAALMAGGVAELLGVDLAMMHYAPGGVFEAVLPFWLFFRGFGAATPTPRTSPTGRDGRRGARTAA